MSAQLSLFTVDDQAPTVGDLEGLLLGGGALVRRGELARISVVAERGPRAETLLSALAERGLGGELRDHDDGRCSVRSDFDPRLLAVVQRWSVGARHRLPRDWVLDPARLRLWAIAGGRADHIGYLLRLGVSDEHLWDPVGAALSAAGLAGAFLGVRAGGPAYRVVGSRRLTRLREMLGAVPDCPADPWLP